MKRLGLALLVVALAAGCAPAPETPPDEVSPPVLGEVCSEAEATGQQAALEASLRNYLEGKTGPEALEGSKVWPACLRTVAMGGDGALLIQIKPRTDGGAATPASPPAAALPPGVTASPVGGPASPLGRPASPATGGAPSAAPASPADVQTAPASPQDGTPAALAWKLADQWQVAVARLEDQPVGGFVTLTEGGPDLLLAVRLAGSAELGRLLHGRLEGGRLVFSPATKAYEKAQFHFLQDGLVLLTYRAGSADPLAWTCDACTPANRQMLLAWNGGEVEVLGEREFSDPYVAASYFLGALQAGFDQRASLYAADPALVSRARQLLHPSPEELVFPWEPMVDVDAGETAELRRLEMRNWDALPEPSRTVLPESSQTYSLPLRKGAARVTLELKRDEAGWKVTDLQPGAGTLEGNGPNISVDEKPRFEVR